MAGIEYGELLWDLWHSIGGARTMTSESLEPRQGRLDESEGEALQQLKLAKVMEQLALAEEQVAEVESELGRRDEAHLMLAHASEHYEVAARAIHRVVEERQRERDLLRRPT